MSSWRTSSSHRRRFASGFSACSLLIQLIVPSKLHETIAEMLRTDANLVLTLARGVLPIADGATAHAAAEALSVPEFRPDSLVEIRNADNECERILVCEAQLTDDPRKLLSLPAYQAAARYRHGVPCDVIVVTPDRKIATRLRKPIQLGYGSVFRAVIIGPDELQTKFEATTVPIEIDFLRTLGTRDPECFATFAARGFWRCSRGTRSYTSTWFSTRWRTLFGKTWSR